MKAKTIKFTAATAALLAAVALSACGANQSDRAVSGGLIGAGAGAVTDPCTLNLGDPWWRNQGGDQAYYDRCGQR